MRINDEVYTCGNTPKYHIQQGPTTKLFLPRWHPSAAELGETPPEPMEIIMIAGGELLHVIHFYKTTSGKE